MTSYVHHAKEVTMNDKPFDPLEAIASLRASERPKTGPKLSRAEQCAAFALIKAEFSHAIVGKVFGLSLASVSHLANCATRAPGKRWYYPDVEREWRRLGENDFVRAYLTEDIFLKAQRLKLAVGQPSDDRTARGPNPNADRFAFDRYGEFQVGDAAARVDWIDGGWRFAFVEEGMFHQGQEALSGEAAPFGTSGEAFDAAFEVLGLKSPRVGRPRK